MGSKPLSNKMIFHTVRFFSAVPLPTMIELRRYNVLAPIDTHLRRCAEFLEALPWPAPRGLGLHPSRLRPQPQTNANGGFVQC